jgi:DNA-directed RNA polymerase subunit N (RpoN/RPB10)
MLFYHYKLFLRENALYNTNWIIIVYSILEQLSMLPPIRCFTCNKVLSHLYEQYNDMITDDISSKEIYNRLGVTRFCCKRMLKCTIDCHEEMGNYLEYLPSTITRKLPQEGVVRIYKAV